jgi:hypothetical protein
MEIVSKLARKLAEDAEEHSSSPKFELFYSTGGHGGPYPNISAAEEAARRLIKGSGGGRGDRERRIDIRVYDANAPGGYGMVVKRVYPED